MRSVALPTLFALLLASSTAGAQVNPADMRSGFVTWSSVVGLISSPLFVVPSGSRFVLTDVTVSRVSGTALMPAYAGNPIRLTINVGGPTPVVRWVGTDRLDGATDPPLQLHWGTGIVFEPNQSVEAAASVLGGPEPFITVNWSGYLAPATTTSVIPGPPSGGDLGLQAWPNPARGSTELSFSLDRSQRVLVGVFAVDGRRVRTLSRGVLGAGEHHLTWDGRDDAGHAVANGVYFAGLETASGRTTRRIARVR
jgi:flagellar hook capping protein FlgD